VEQVQRRLKLFEELYKKQEEKISQMEKKEISITLPDGKVIKGVQL
jgi:hypothetical protein